MVRAAIACTLLSAILLDGCKKSETQADKAAAQGILLIGNKVEPSSLDPQLTTSVEEGNIERALFEGLVSPNPKTLAPEAALADKWEVSPDGLRYTFHLREGVAWSDGTPLTSADFLFAWHRLLTPSLASINAPLLYCVRGAKAFNEGITADFSTVAVNTPDARTLVVELEQPTPWFFGILMHQATCALPQKFICSCGGAFNRSNGWTRRPDMPASGAFTMAKWQPNSLIEVEKNPKYWDAAKVRLIAIRFFPIDSINVEETAFQGGQLHITDTVPVNKVAFLRNQNNSTLLLNPYLGVYYYVFNTTHKPLDNPDVRLAMSLAIDRTTIAGKLLGGAQIPAQSFLPEGVGGYQPAKLVKMDIALAKKLLAKAGYPNGEGFPKLELLFNTSENHRMIAEAVQAMWKQNLGIEVELRNEDFNSYLSTRGAGNFDILRASWVADYPTAASFLDLLRSDSGNNFAHWKSVDYDRLMDESKTAASEVERNKLYRKAESTMLNDAPIMPIYLYNTTRLISPAVHGWDSNAMDWHPYKYVWLEGAKEK
jgi:oligopeptide transport system substrate-binding protein